LAAALAVIGAVLGAAVLTGASEQEGGKRYRAVFDNAFGLTEGGDLKIAGVRAGQTTKFKVSRQRPRKAVVELELTEPGVGELREDATCEIRPQSLIGEYFVDCQPGRSSKRLEPGGTIPVEQTSSTIPIDLVNNVLRLPYRERLRLIIAELGTGLAGRPDDLAEVLRRAHPGLRETNRTLRILARQDQIIQRFVADARDAVAALEDRKADVVRWAREAGETAEISASRRAELADNFRRLPGFLDELRPYMARLGELADEQVPLLRDLQDAAPDLDLFLSRLGPFSDASRPAFRALGRASATGTAAFRETREEIAELRELAEGAPAVAKPLRQFLQTLDDRRRAVENDPRAKASGPPAPDKTHIPENSEGGFTGMEAFWDYFFWQALAINGRDDVGHILRIAGLENDCTGYRSADADPGPDVEDVFERCNQWLGPDQPGITSPDPVEGGSTAAASAGGRASSPRAGGGTGDAPRAGAPATVPATPPALRRSLGDLVGGREPGGRLPGPSLPRGGGLPGGADTLLDFLLTP
jgi:virulence factor Mce-like protein